MTKKHRLSYLLICLAFLAATGALVACKQAIVPTDQDVVKAYQDNRKEFGEVVTKLMAEGNKRYIIRRDRSVTYQAGDKPPLSDAAIGACLQIMRRTFCVGARRTDGMAQFIFFEDDTPDYFRSKSLLYDSADFVGPNWISKTGDNLNIRYTPIEANWKVEYRYEKKGASK